MVNFESAQRILKPVDMAAALASGSTTRPLLSQPWVRTLPLLLGSGPNPFEATRKPSTGPPRAADRRPNPLAGMDLKNEKLAASLATMRDGAAQLAAMQATLEDVPDLCGTTCQEAALVRVRVRVTVGLG